MCARATTRQLLDEMMDYSIPFTTEPNNLKDIVAPPDALNVLSGNGTQYINCSTQISERETNAKAYLDVDVFVDRLSL
jgi:hypothetical protein